MSTGRLVHTLTQPDSGPQRIWFVPDGQCLASSGPSGTQVWDVATGRLLHDVPVATSHERLRQAVAFNGAGKVLAAPHPSQGPVEDVTTRFWNLATGGEVFMLDEAPERFPCIL